MCLLSSRFYRSPQLYFGCTGDQARIVFTLIGEPPFTFTYQRSEFSSKKGNKPGKVLETHTVSRLMTHEYTISSALEGTSSEWPISPKYPIDVIISRYMDCHCHLRSLLPIPTSTNWAGGKNPLVTYLIISCFACFIQKCNSSLTYEQSNTQSRFVLCNY